MRIWAVVLTATFTAGLLVAGASGCRRSSEGAGRPDAAARPARVVSLSPSTTEALFAIGAGDRAVGRSRFCDSPTEALRLPIVGGYTDPNFEVIFALSPTLVVGARGPAGPRLEDRLKERGIRTFFPETESVAQIETMLTDLGRLVGREREAGKLVEDTRLELAAIARALSGKARPRVLMLFDVEPVVAAGPKSFPDEMLRLAGGTNAVIEGAPYPVLGIERVLALDPDVVLDTTVAMDRRTSRVKKDAPGWEKLRAVREGRVIGIGDESVLRPGPRVAAGVRSIAQALHPELERGGLDASR